MTTDFFVKVVLSCITIMSAFITIVLVPYLHSKLGAQELEKLTGYVRVAVRCAEQIYSKEEWRLKKDYVMNYAKEVISGYLNLSITDQQLNTIVEGIVNEIKYGKENIS